MNGNARIFLFEHVTGGGEAGQSLPAELARQGLAMWRAIAEDLLEAGCAVHTTREARFHEMGRHADEGHAQRGRLHVTPIVSSKELPPAFDRLAHEADAALLIAPETDGVLARWTERLEAHDTVNLGSKSNAIALTADKYRLARHLHRHGVPTLDTRLTPEELAPPIVIKPRDGAGCEQTVCSTASDRSYFPQGPRAGEREHKLVRSITQHDAEATESHRRRNAMIFQPWHAGDPVSASLIVGPDGRATPLRAGRQRIEHAGDGTLRYQGGELPIERDLETRALALGEKACAAVPGLRGFVGIDLILGKARDHDRVVEINPRPTVSFVALRALAQSPLTAMMLDRNTAPAWGDETLRFDAAGEMGSAP